MSTLGVLKWTSPWLMTKGCPLFQTQKCRRRTGSYQALYMPPFTYRPQHVLCPEHRTGPQNRRLSARVGKTQHGNTGPRFKSSLAGSRETIQKASGFLLKHPKAANSSITISEEHFAPRMEGLARERQQRVPNRDTMGPQSASGLPWWSAGFLTRRVKAIP